MPSAMRKNNIFKITAMLAIAMLLVILAWISLTPEVALSQQVESRINNLEFDLRNIESRLGQIESQVGQSIRSQSPRTTVTPNNQVRNRQLARLQSFDKLANLAIETRQDLKQLEARVAKLESRVAPRNPR
jgi:BMFP domain-containing protein YqiC